MNDISLYFFLDTTLEVYLIYTRESQCTRHPISYHSERPLKILELYNKHIHYIFSTYLICNVNGKLRKQEECIV